MSPEQIGQGMPGMSPQEDEPFEMADPKSRQLGVKAIENILDAIYGDQWENTLRELSAAPQEQLTETVGRMVASAYIIQEVYAQAAGKQMPQEIALDIGRQLVEEMFTILDTQGIFRAKDETQEQQMMTEALAYAAKYYRMHLEGSGRFDEQAAMQLGQDIRGGKYDSPGSPPSQPAASGVQPPMPGVQQPMASVPDPRGAPGELLNRARSAAQGAGR